MPRKPAARQPTMTCRGRPALPEISLADADVTASTLEANDFGRTTI